MESIVKCYLLACHSSVGRLEMQSSGFGVIVGSMTHSFALGKLPSLTHEESKSERKPAILN